MDKLTQEEWNDLTPEEQADRESEKPVEKVKDQANDDLLKTVKDLTEKVKSLENEKHGIYRDLKSAEQSRQQLEAALAELNKRGAKGDIDLDEIEDSEYLTAGQVKKIIAGLKNEALADDTAAAKQRSAQNYSADEERMTEATSTKSDEFPIPYAEAMEEFKAMASKNRAYWTAVHEESIRTNGKPAEVAYRIALTSKKFLGKLKASVREELLNDLEKQGDYKPKKLPPGGSGKPEINAAQLSEEELLNLSDAQLDQLLESTG